MARTITDIIPPSKRRQMNDIPMSSAEPMGSTPVPPPPPTYERPVPPPPVRAPRKFPWGTAIVAIVVVLLSVGAMSFFTASKVAVTPRTNTGAVSGSFTATPDSGELPMRVVTVEKTASKSVAAESTVTANDAAQGTITIYNEQSASQELVKNTRFETAAGQIFRIRDSVVVPAGAPGKPGTLNASVYADSPGEAYNIGPSSFTIPGFKTSSPTKYAQVYGKSTAAMTGGFQGQRPSVGEATATKERAAIQPTLDQELATALAAQVPEGYVLVPGAKSVAYVPLTDAKDPDNSTNVLVREKGTATAVIFLEEAFARAVAQQVIGQGYAGQPVTIPDVSTLSISATTPPSMAAPYTFTLSGNATVVWKVDTEKIAGSVAGKTRESARVLVMGLPEVEKAVITLRPFWSGTLPDEPSQIKVTITGEDDAK